MYRVGELDAGAASGGVPAPAPSMAMAAAVGAYKRKAAAEATTPEQTLPKRATGEDGPPATATANDAAAATTTTPDPAPSAGATIVPLHRTLCPTRRNFTTAVAATLTCDACGDTCVKHETFRHLSVEIPVGTGGGAAAAASAAANLGAVPLESLLNGFFAAETLERTCEKPGCDGKRATLSRKIVRLPRVPRRAPEAVPVRRESLRCERRKRRRGRRARETRGGGRAANGEDCQARRAPDEGVARKLRVGRRAQGPAAARVDGRERGRGRVAGGVAG